MQKLLRFLADAISGKEKEFTTGSIKRAIVLLAIPMVLEMIMESLFAVVDVFFVSKVGVDAVATVGLTESIVTLIYSIAIGLSMAASAMVARRIGEKEKEKAQNAAAQAILLAIVISLVVGVVGIIFAGDILRFMGGSESVIATGTGYTRILLGSNIVIMLLFLLNGIFRGAGDASLAMRSLWIANGINIILDPLFIFGIGPFPELGVQGAAVATTIGRGIGVLFQLSLLFRGSGILKLAKRHFQLQKKILLKLADVMITGAGQFLIASASWVFLMRIIAIFGSEAVAGYTIAIRLIVFTILPSWGMANAAATLVGQNLGADHPERAEASVWKAAFYNMIFMVSVSIIYLFFAYPILGFFTSEPLVLESAVLALRIICAGYLFFAYGMVVSQAFNGAGDTRTPTFVNLICFWMVEIPLGYLLAVHLKWELAGVCWAIVIAEALMTVLVIYFFRRGKWKQVEI